MGYNLDLSFLTEYSLRIGWSSSGYTSSLVTIPQDLTNASDPLNYLSLEGFIGLPILPGAIINPLENLVLTYQLASQEPSLQITKSVSNASKLAFSLPTLTTSIKNIGSYPVWGLPFNLTVFGITNDPRTNVISNYIMSQTGLTISAGLIQALAQNGHPWSTLFPNVLPRIFLIDTLGTGIPNNFYPDLSFLTSALKSLATNDTTAGLTAALESPTGIALFAPYGVPFANALIQNPLAYEQYFSNGYTGLAEMVALYELTNSSLFNLNLYTIAPGQVINYSTPLNGTLIDSYTPFDNFNIANIPNTSPIISYGSEVSGSSVVNTYTNDGLSWQIQSEPLENTNIVQTYLTFQNSTTIPFGLNTIDDLNFDMNYSLTGTVDSAQIEVFNYTGASGQGFETIPLTGFTTNQNNLNFSLTDIDYNISNFYNVADNYSSLIRLTFQSTTPFHSTLKVSN